MLSVADKNLVPCRMIHENGEKLSGEKRDLETEYLSNVCQFLLALC